MATIASPCGVWYGSLHFIKVLTILCESLAVNVFFFGIAALATATASFSRRSFLSFPGAPRFSIMASTKEATSPLSRDCGIASTTKSLPPKSLMPTPKPLRISRCSLRSTASAAENSSVIGIRRFCIPKEEIPRCEEPSISSSKKIRNCARRLSTMASPFFVASRDEASRRRYSPRTPRTCGNVMTSRTSSVENAGSGMMLRNVGTEKEAIFFGRAESLGENVGDTVGAEESIPSCLGCKAFIRALSTPVDTVFLMAFSLWKRTSRFCGWTFTSIKLPGRVICRRKAGKRLSVRRVLYPSATAYDTVGDDRGLLFMKICCPDLFGLVYEGMPTTPSTIMSPSR